MKLEKPSGVVIMERCCTLAKTVSVRMKKEDQVREELSSMVATNLIATRSVARGDTHGACANYKNSRMLIFVHDIPQYSNVARTK